jgi:hypothetical protein
MIAGARPSAKSRLPLLGSPCTSCAGSGTGRRRSSSRRSASVSSLLPQGRSPHAIRSQVRQGLSSRENHGGIGTRAMARWKGAARGDGLDPTTGHPRLARDHGRRGPVIDDEPSARRPPRARDAEAVLDDGRHRRREPLGLHRIDTRLEDRVAGPPGRSLTSGQSYGLASAQRERVEDRSGGGSDRDILHGASITIPSSLRPRSTADSRTDRARRTTVRPTAGPARPRLFRRSGVHERG